ncbi:hypothetical protein KEM48_010194, partial [Puccinia striiformis f. sp. tritici PST-130]
TAVPKRGSKIEPEAERLNRVPIIGTRWFTLQDLRSSMVVLDPMLELLQQAIPASNPARSSGIPDPSSTSLLWRNNPSVLHLG